MISTNGKFQQSLIIKIWLLTFITKKNISLSKTNPFCKCVIFKTKLSYYEKKLSYYMKV